MLEQQNTFFFWNSLSDKSQNLSKYLAFSLFYVNEMPVFPFLTRGQTTTFKESIINRLSNLIDCNRSAVKLSQVLCSNLHTPRSSIKSTKQEFKLVSEWVSHWQGLPMIGLGPIRILRLPSWPKYHDIQTQASNFDYSTTKNAFPTRHQLGFAKLLYLWFCKCWMQFLWSNAPGNCPPLCQNNYLSRSPRGQQWNVVNFCKVRYNRAIEDLKNSTCRQ